jgi:hypothetical protein
MRRMKKDDIQNIAVLIFGVLGLTYLLGNFFYYCLLPNINPTTVHKFNWFAISFFMIASLVVAQINQYYIDKLFPKKVN